MYRILNSIQTIGGILLLCACVMAVPAQARIYKWVDKDGTVQYTQTPPPGDIEAEEIKPPPSVDTDAAARELEKQRAALDKSRDGRLKAAEEAQQSQQESAERQQKCEQARTRLAAYDRPRVNVVGDDGARRRATEEERNAEQARAREMVNKLCD